MEESVGFAGDKELEALLLAAPGPVSVEALSQFLPDVASAVARLQAFWSRRGMNVQVRGGEVSFIPSPVCQKILSEAQGEKTRRLSQAAVETLSYIAMHQPVTLADIERGRGLKVFRGVIDSLLDAGFIRVSARRTDSGRAVSYVTTDAFLEHFGLSALADLPTPEELPDLVDPPSDEIVNLEV